VTLFSRLADLEVTVERAERERVALEAPRFLRVSTVVVLSGGGHTGRGEDVSYMEADQDAHARLPILPEPGRRTLAEWSELLDGVDLFPVPPGQPAARDFRRWAYESSLLDLGLRQAGLSLADAFGRTARPVRFCASPSLNLETLLAAYPDLELKLDAEWDWTDADMARFAELGRVRVVDLKGHYVGEWIRHPDDPPAFYARVAAAFPEAVLEDPVLTAGTAPVVEAEARRVSFDAPVHSLADLLQLPRTGWCNIKPSRFGTVARLLEVIEHCEREGIALYGGGQFEIGPGRGQIQAIASVFYPDGPNDVAPGGYNAPVPADGLPASPLPLEQGAVGLAF
jgi:L-alanine-DL-glutamate epimerase-like enolase superfamily enzyme